MLNEKSEKFYNSNLLAMEKSEYRYQELYETAIKLIPFNKNPKILDIGCGIGSFANYIHNINYTNYVGIDFADDLLNHARNRFPELKFKKGNFLDSKTLDKFKKFDLFVSFEVLEHIREDLKLVSAIPSKRIFIFSVPNITGHGHVRYFLNIQSVIDRYKDLLIFDENSFDITKLGKPHHHLFLFKTVRK